MADILWKDNRFTFCLNVLQNTRYSKLGQSTNCIKGKDGYSVGDVGANAVYQIGANQIMSCIVE